MSTIYTVSQLNQEMKILLETHPNFRNLFIRGEISNYKLHSSGHCYFSLKDRDATIACVMFRSDVQKLRFRPENGMAVILHGRISAYPKTGQVQVYANELMPDGAGALNLQFEQLKRKLYEEGLFDEKYKKPLPLYPTCAAVVTSPTGAAVQDMLRILGRRFPCAEVLIYPSLVQGAEAPTSLIRALRRADADGLADVILIGRGGGSMEDLWAFNDEGLARAIFAANTPVVSAVGHEPDVTISDFVADVRAATPSAAAELITPDREELYLILDSARERAENAMLRLIDQNRALLLREKRALQLYHPERRLSELHGEVQASQDRMCAAVQRVLRAERAELQRMSQRQNQAVTHLTEKKRHQLTSRAAALEQLSPLRILVRGYAAVTKEGGKRVASVKELLPQEQIRIRFADGTATAAVQSIDTEKEPVE